MSICKYILPLIFGFIIDLFLGDPYIFPHPVRLIGKLIAFLERKVRLIFKEHLKAGGVILTLIVATLSFLISYILLKILYKNIIIGIIIEGVMCYYLIAAKCLKTESMKVHDAVESGDIEESRKAVSMIVGRDTKQLDITGIVKAAVETVAENTSDGVIAPLFFIMLGGAPLGFLYKAVNTMDSMIGYRDEKYREIGYFSAKLDDVLNYIPSRISALLMISVCPVFNYNTSNAYRIWRRDRRKHASPNSAQTESVCAGALDIQLAGDAFYFGKLHKKPYIGDKVREVENDDIIKANKLMYASSVFMLIIALLFRAALYFFI